MAVVFLLSGPFVSYPSATVITVQFVSKRQFLYCDVNGVVITSSSDHRERGSGSAGHTRCDRSAIDVRASVNMQHHENCVYNVHRYSPISTVASTGAVPVALASRDCGGTCAVPPAPPPPQRLLATAGVAIRRASSEFGP